MVPRTMNVPALSGAAVAGATGIGYLVIIDRQGPPYDVPRVSLVAALIFGSAATAGFAATRYGSSIAKSLLIGTSVGLWMLGVAGLFSVGLPLLLAGTLTLVGAVRAMPVSSAGQSLSTLDGRLRHNIVEGEPGIFPDPIARFLRWVSGPLRRSERDETKDEPDAGRSEEHGDA